MITPIRVGVAGKSSSDGLLKRPDCPLCLTVGFAIANSYPIVLNPEGLAQPVQTSSKLRAIVGPDISGLPPAGDNPLV
jgi:hypothetical protein